MSKKNNNKISDNFKEKHIEALENATLLSSYRYTIKDIVDIASQNIQFMPVSDFVKNLHEPKFSPDCSACQKEMIVELEQEIIKLVTQLGYTDVDANGFYNNPNLFMSKKNEY